MRIQTTLFKKCDCGKCSWPYQGLRVILHNGFFFSFVGLN